VILLALLLLAETLLSSQTGYDQDAVGLFTTALVSLMITILASMRGDFIPMAEYRMLKESLELVDVLHDVMEQEQK
jgi:hypothetical protein